MDKINTSYLGHFLKKSKVNAGSLLALFQLLKANKGRHLHFLKKAHGRIILFWFAHNILAHYFRLRAKFLPIHYYNYN